MKGHTKTIWCLASIPDSTFFVSGSLDGKCRVWSATDGIEGREKNGSWEHGVRNCRIKGRKDDGERRAQRHDRSVDSSEQEEDYVSSNGKHRISVECLAMSQDSETIMILGLLLAAMNGHICVTYSHSGEDEGALLEGHMQNRRFIQSLVWSASDQLISGSDDETIKFWDPSNGSLIATNYGHTDTVCSLALSSDGKLLASASWDKTARLWNTSTDSTTNKLALPSNIPLVFTLLPFPPMVITLPLQAKIHNVYIWDVQVFTEDLNHCCMPSLRVFFSQLTPAFFVIQVPEVQPQPPLSAIAEQDNHETQVDSSEGERAQSKIDAEDTRHEPSWLDQPAVILPGDDAPPKDNPSPGRSAGPGKQHKIAAFSSSRSPPSPSVFVTVAAARAKKFIAVVRGGRRYPKNMTISKWSMPWIKLAYRRQQKQMEMEKRANATAPGETTAEASDTATSSQGGQTSHSESASGTSQPASASSSNAADGSLAKDNSRPSTPSSSSQSSYAVSEISYTKREMFLIWLCYPRRVD
ncbi:WD40-repeat-containing domain protein [Melanogaster broomeanus]|nr:WD40-repeat-containing domain protein [Melanogaster broomeanus]